MWVLLSGRNLFVGHCASGKILKAMVRLDTGLFNFWELWLLLQRLSVSHEIDRLTDWFFNKRPLKSYDWAHGFFLFVRRSFSSLWIPVLKSICEQHFKVGTLSNSILWTGSCIFASVVQIVMWLLEAMLQSRETLNAVNVYPQSSVTTASDTSHDDRITSSFPL